MRFVLLHAKGHALETLRMPAYWAPALAFPLLFFVLFGLANSNRLAGMGLGSEYAITPFLLYTTLNVTVASLAAGVAADRENPWENRLRLLPISAFTRFAGRLVYVLGFNLVSWIPLLVVAAVTTDLTLPVYAWPLWLGSVLLGAVPFGLLGMAIGYRFPPQPAMMIANILFMGLAFFGGLFVPVDLLPEALRGAVPFFPTYQYQSFVLQAIDRGDHLAGPAWVAVLLLAWTAVFAVLARAGFRRDEGVRYG